MCVCVEREGVFHRELRVCVWGVCALTLLHAARVCVSAVSVFCLVWLLTVCAVDGCFFYLFDILHVRDYMMYIILAARHADAVW